MNPIEGKLNWSKWRNNFINWKECFIQDTIQNEIISFQIHWSKQYFFIRFQCILITVFSWYLLKIKSIGEFAVESTFYFQSFKTVTAFFFLTLYLTLSNLIDRRISKLKWLMSLRKKIPSLRKNIHKTLHKNSLYSSWVWWHLDRISVW